MLTSLFDNGQILPKRCMIHICFILIIAWQQYSGKQCGSLAYRCWEKQFRNAGLPSYLLESSIQIKAKDENILKWPFQFDITTASPPRK